MGYLDDYVQAEEPLPQPRFGESVGVYCPVCNDGEQTLVYRRPKAENRRHLLAITCDLSGIGHRSFYKTFTVDPYIAELNGILDTYIHSHPTASNLQRIVSPYLTARRKGPNRFLNPIGRKKRRTMQGNTLTQQSSIKRKPEPCPGVHNGSVMLKSPSHTEAAHSRCANEACISCCRYAGAKACAVHKNPAYTSTHETPNPPDLPSNDTSQRNQIVTERISETSRPATTSQNGRRTGGIISAAQADQVLVGLKVNRSTASELGNKPHMVTLAVWFGPGVTAKPELFKYPALSWPYTRLNECEAFAAAAYTKLGGSWKEKFKVWSESEGEWVRLGAHVLDEYPDSTTKILVAQAEMSPNQCGELDKHATQLMSETLKRQTQDAMNIFPFLSKHVGSPSSTPPLPAPQDPSSTSNKPAMMWTPSGPSVAPKASTLESVLPPQDISEHTPIIIDCTGSDSDSADPPEDKGTPTPSNNERPIKSSPEASASALKPTEPQPWREDDLTNSDMLRFLVAAGPKSLKAAGPKAQSRNRTCKSAFIEVWGDKDRTIFKKSTVSRHLRFLRKVGEKLWSEYTANHPTATYQSAKEHFLSAWQQTRCAESDDVEGVDSMVRPKSTPVKAK